MTDRCGMCGRPLSDPASREAGIGPICAGKHRRALDEIERRFEENLTCHHGMQCYNPRHGLVTLRRFAERFHAMAGQVGIAPGIMMEASQLVRGAIDALGLELDEVPVPQLQDVPVTYEALKALGVRAHNGPGGALTFNVPADFQLQYRRTRLREMRICRFGLDCREPQAAVRNLWRLLSLMRSDIEPFLASSTRGADWRWDLELYQHLGNTFEVLGYGEQGRAIQAQARARNLGAGRRGRRNHG